MGQRPESQPELKRLDSFDQQKIREMRLRCLEPGFGIQPEKYLVRSDHFLRMFNEDFKLTGKKAVSRRTLQFYGSPQLRMFPLPKYQNRHTAYYLFPDDYDLLGVIWTMRSRLFMPLNAVRAILKIAHRDLYQQIIFWNESPEALVDMVLMYNTDFEPEDLQLYRVAKDVMTEAYMHSVVRHNGDRAQRLMVEELTEKYVRSTSRSGNGSNLDARASSSPPWPRATVSSRTFMSALRRWHPKRASKQVRLPRKRADIFLR
jgi:hypothetical protein